jgi:hypothetical protein
LFGKRVDKEWEYEARFFDAKGREIGEFDIDSLRFADDEGDYKLKVNSRLKHPELCRGRPVSVYPVDVLVPGSMVEQEGRISLFNRHPKQDINNPAAGIK